MTLPSSEKISVARLLRGFSSSSNEGMRPKTPNAVSVSMTATRAKGAKAAIQIHRMVLGSMPVCFFFAIAANLVRRYGKSSEKLRIEN